MRLMWLAERPHDLKLTAPPKRLVHRRFRRHIPRINPLRRIYRKQLILTSITSHTSSSRAHSHQPSTPPGVLLTHAPSVSAGCVEVAAHETG